MRSSSFSIRRRVRFHTATMVALALIGAALPISTADATVQAAGEECCNIVSVDARAGVVSARETTSGRTFTFRVNDAALLGSLAAGQSFDTDPAVSRLNDGDTFSLVRATAGARPLGRPARGFARPTVSRADDCCNLVSAPAQGGVSAGAAAAARPAAESAMDALISRGGVTPPIMPPSVPEPVNYAIDLVELHCRKIWFSGIGERDRVLLELWAYDAGSDDKGLYVAHTFTCRNDVKKYLSLQPIFAAAGLDGDVMVSGNFTVTHPQNGQNVIDALRDLGEAEVDLADVILTSELVELPDGVTKLVATFTGAGGIREKIAEWRGNWWVELFRLIGRAVCAGGSPFTWNKSIGLNPLDLSFFNEWGGEVYKLWYISEGAKPETCFREIKYDLFARIRAN